MPTRAASAEKSHSGGRTRENMHVTACLAGQTMDVEVGENCRTLLAVKEAIVVALPKLHVEGFDVSVGGRALDDEGIVSLEESVCLDVSANTRVLSVLALREAGREVSEEGLLGAAARGDRALCALYVDAGVPLPTTNTNRTTALHLASQAGQVQVCELLVDRGHALLCTQAGTGATPLHLAVDEGRLEVCELLLDRGHDVQCRTATDGAAPLHGAAFSGHRELCELLLDRGHDVQCCTSCGETPLHAAAFYGEYEVCELLLDRGHDVQCRTTNGVTPLHAAAYGGYEAVCLLLLDRGHEIQCVNVAGETPLHLAAESGSEEVCDVLVARGHALDCRNRANQTPLSVAKVGSPAMIDRLSP